jgi:hypothetical protein
VIPSSVERSCRRARRVRQTLRATSISTDSALLVAASACLPRNRAIREREETRWLD